MSCEKYAPRLPLVRQLVLKVHIDVEFTRGSCTPAWQDGGSGVMVQGKQITAVCDLLVEKGIHEEVV